MPDDDDLPEEAKQELPEEGEILEPPDHEVEGGHELGDQHAWAEPGSPGA